MEKNENKLTTREKVLLTVNGIILVVGGVAIGRSIYRERKLNRLLNNSIARISDLTDVQVSEGLVNAGIERAVSREVGKIAHKAAEKCSEDISEQVIKRVGEACKKSYGKIESEVATRIATEVGKVCKDDLIEDIRIMAKEQIADQFESKLDDVLENYNSNLTNINKIYQSIADKMAPRGSDKGIELKLS